MSSESRPIDQNLRVAYLTAGAAGMYCGSCLVDNALVLAMRHQGANVQLLPTYTPIRTDEENISTDQVFFGGINIYLQQKIPFFRFLPPFLDRIFDNPRLIQMATKKSTSIDAKFLGALSHSMLLGKHGHQRKEGLRLCRWLRDHLRPEVIVLSNVLIAGFLPTLKELLPETTIVVTLQGDDIFLNELSQNYRKKCLDQIKKLHPFVDGYLLHSDYYKNYMTDLLEIPPEKCHLVPLGLNLDDFTDSQRPLVRTSSSANNAGRLDKVPSHPFMIGYLARLAPEKGLHLLVDAFIELKKTTSLDVHLKIAGWLGDHRIDYAQEQFDKLAEAGLQESYEYVGSVDRQQKLEFLQSIDLLSVPTTYPEPKGLFALEAVACGVPTLLPDHGALPELTGELKCGLLFDTDDPADLLKGLQTIITDTELYNRLKIAGRENLFRLRNNQDLAKRHLQIYSDLRQNQG